MSRGKKGIIRIAAMLYVVAFLFFVWGFTTGKHGVFPWNVLSPIYEEISAYLTHKSGPKKSHVDKIILDHQEYNTRFKISGFTVRDPSFHDTGFLLLSRYSKEDKHVLVELLSLAEKKILHAWIPPFEEIFRQTPTFQDDANTTTTYRAQHPLLLKDGGLIFSSGEGPLVRINACGELVWAINRHFHHSIERDHLGRIVTPIVLEGNNRRIPLPIKDDGFAIVSMDGAIIDEYSITDILIRNGYRGLIYGVGTYEEDRIHLNDAQPILTKTRNANIGDIALSSRHLSTVFLFDPQYGRIRWLKTGPWLNQHDVNPLENGQYSIFGNDVVRQYNKRDFLINTKMSNIYIYDPRENVTMRPYSKVMSRHRIATWTAGRTKILANGDAYIEESDRGRLLRVSEDAVRWEYVNAISPGTVGAVHWSRYISGTEIDLSWKENMECE